MGTVGDAYDDAMAEGFFASLEGGLIERSKFPSYAQACMTVFTWIEGWYTPGPATVVWASVSQFFRAASHE